MYTPPGAGGEPYEGRFHPTNERELVRYLPAGSDETGGGGTACDETDDGRPYSHKSCLPVWHDGRPSFLRCLHLASLRRGYHPSCFRAEALRTRLPSCPTRHCRRPCRPHHPESSRQNRTRLLGAYYAASCASYCGGASICTWARFYCGSRGVHVSSSPFLTHSSRKTLPIAANRFDSANVFTRKYPPTARRYTSGTSVA